MLSNGRARRGKLFGNPLEGLEILNKSFKNKYRYQIGQIEQEYEEGSKVKTKYHKLPVK